MTVDDDGSVDEEQEVLTRLKEEVVQEVERRSKRVSLIEAELAIIQDKISEVPLIKSVIRGNAAQVGAAGALVRKLRNEFEASKNRLVVAREDLSRAQNRLKEINKELAQLQEEARTK